MEKAAKLAEKIYNISSILQQYCRINDEDFEVAKISTLVDCIYQNADYLNAAFINEFEEV